MDWQVIFTAQQQAELQPAPPDEATLGPHELLVRTRYSAVSSGTETAVYEGHLGPSFPCGTGYAAVCEVTAVGGEVTCARPGDLVFAMAGHRSSHRLLDTAVSPVPDGLPPDEAVLVRLMGVTMSTLVTTTARPPGKVLVTGLGIVGLLGAQIFQSCGYEVHAVDPDPNRREAAAELGLRHVYSEVPWDDPAVTGQVALALECSGHEAAALDACRAVRKRGEVVLVGVPWVRRTDLPAHDLLHAIFHQYAVVRSGWEWEVPREPTDFVTGDMRANFAAGLRWLAEGRVRVGGLYQLMSPRDCQIAYQGLMHRTLERPAVVFDWSALDDAPPTP
jgi:threonine dehydrogenase-like Zn-dependent dehydrogenase